MAQPVPLLRTKLFIPSRRSKRVARPALITRINEALDKTLILVSAPAGSGKTTLLAEWAHQVNPPVAWLSLDESDNDPYRFLSYCIAALSAALQDPAVSTFTVSQALLNSVQQVPINPILVALVNELTDIEQTLFLVLDDYQFINNPVVDELLTFILEHLPPQIHVLLASRVDPGMPLHRLRARQQLVELRMDDLRFSVHEASAFLNDVMELNLSGEEIIALDTRTEGWVVGLQMAALSMQGIANRTAFIEAFSGTHRYVLEYLIGEVLSSQPDAIKTFLLYTSILDRLSASLCDTVTGIEKSQSILEYLERSNIFLISLDPVREWYRYHHLFANLLQARLLQDQPEILETLHTRASQWYESNGYPEQSIQHALAARDPDRAARLVEWNAISILSRGEMSVLLRLFDNIPEALMLNRPRLSVLHAWALTFSGQFRRAESRLLTAEKQLSQSDIEMERGAIQGGIALIRGVIADFQGDIATAVELAHLADSLLEKDDLSERSIVPFILGDGFFAAGELDKAAQAFQEIRTIGETSGNLWTIAVAIHKLVLVKKVQGQLNTVEQLYTDALQLASEKKGQQYGSLGAVLTGMSDLYRERNLLDEAREWGERAIKNMEHWPNPTDLLNAYCTQAQIFLALGRMDEAEAALNQAGEVSQSKGIFPITRQNLEASRVKFWLATGKKDLAGRWLSQKWSASEAIPGRAAINYMNELEWITTARVLIANHESGPALNLLQELKTSAEAGGRYGRLVEIMVLTAIALQKTEQTERAVNGLFAGLELAEPEGYMRIFLDEGLSMAGLLQACRSRATGQILEYIDRLLNAFIKPEFASATQIQSDGLVEHLTRRELEILSLLAAGLTNQEIAARLVLSEGTIKTHTHNLYSKLDVQTRTKAIARARELKLI